MKVIFLLSITFRFNSFNISSLYKVILFKKVSLPSRIVKQLVLLSEKASFTMIKAILIDTKQVVLLFKMISLLTKMLILYKVQTLWKLKKRGWWDYSEFRNSEFSFWNVGCHIKRIREIDLWGAWSVQEISRERYRFIYIIKLFNINII